MQKVYFSTSKELILIFITIIFCISPILAFGQIQDQLKWERLPPIPDTKGFSGMFAGVSNDALICMGGANFADKNHGLNDLRKWSDKIYVLEENAASWITSEQKLVRPLAYGASFTYKDNIILVGGSDGEKHYPEVYTLSYQKGKIGIKTLAPLPFPLANMTGALVGDVLFIAGGNRQPDDTPGKYFLALNLAEEPSDQHWVLLDAWPGPGRMQAVSASLKDSFFLFSGIQSVVKPDEGNQLNILQDAYMFAPQFEGRHLKGGKWKKLTDMPRGVAGGASPAPIMGSDHILFPGGLNRSTSTQKSPEAFSELDTTLLAYHLASNSWLKFGGLPQTDSRIKLTSVKWGQKWVMPNGEKGMGSTSSEVFALSKNLSFGWINWAILITYLGFMLWMGFLFDKQEQTTKNFFTASGKIPWWAAGLSIYGAQFSAISFMALPAIVYATDWALAIGTVIVLLTVPIVVKFYVPFFRRLSITSAYEYLEYRFNSNIRIIGSLSFILFQLCRMGVVLFLPAIAICSVTGINIYLIISIMGIICILYTVMGGMEAVVWTDVVQVVILTGGAVLCLIVAIAKIDGGIIGVISKGMEDQKFTLVHLGWEPDRLVLWVAIVGFFFLNLIPYTSDQSIIQRYYTVKDERAVAKSLWINALFTLPTIPIFFGIGTVLYVFYNNNPMVIPSEQVGEVLPYFVVQELPVGIAGLIIAGIFAASQSTLSAGMNSISAAYVTDIHARFNPHSDRDTLFVAKLVTVAGGVFGIVCALLIAIFNIEFIFNLFQEILGIVGGTLAGVFILGIFTKRANARGVIWGIVIGVFAVWMTKNYTVISVYLYGAISVIATVISGYLVSLFGRQTKDINGLTYLTLNKKDSNKKTS